MGAGASTTGMSTEKRREMFEELKEQYTLTDLDSLAAEEKQAWLEIAQEKGAIVREMPNPGIGSTDLQLTEVACDVHGRLAVDDAAGRKASDAAVREKPVVSAATQEASAKRSSELLARLCDDFEVIPQRRGTRLSYHLAEGTGGESCGIQGPNASGSQIVKADGIEPILKPSDGEDTKTGEEKERRAGPSETPCWRAAAERVETARELCVGDVVRVRDKNFQGMWFEGLLSAIHDQSSFQVEITGEDPSLEAEYVTVGRCDIMRVMPWHSIEVGDSVECQPEGDPMWCRGTVVQVLPAEAAYIVQLESYSQDEETREGDDDADVMEKEGTEDEVRNLRRVTENHIRKLNSIRSSAAERWKKVLHARGAMATLRELGKGKVTPMSSHDSPPTTDGQGGGETTPASPPEVVA